MKRQYKHKERNKSILPETTEDINTDFNVGDFVSVKGTNTTGKILEMFHDSKKATLLVGTVKMQVPLQNLIHSAKKIEEKKEREYSFINFQVEMRLDIRGERPEEAEFEVNKFVDNAYAAGLERIEILHGKGTGALKKTVKEILLHHNRVKTFYFAPIEIGGDGITIAELK